MLELLQAPFAPIIKHVPRVSMTHTAGGAEDKNNAVMGARRVQRGIRYEGWGGVGRVVLRAANV